MSQHTYARRREYYKERALDRYYENRDAICAAWRQRYATDPVFREQHLESCKVRRARRRAKAPKLARAPYGSLRILAALKLLGIVPDAQGMLVLPTDSTPETLVLVERLCAASDRFDWKFEGDEA